MGRSLGRLPVPPGGGLGEAIALAGHATALAANGSPSAPLVLEEAVRRTAAAGLEGQAEELQRLLDAATASAEQIET